MGRIFLSYSREDRSCAEALARVLEDGGHEVWWDRHIDTGTQFSKEIEQALDRADLVVVAWSRDAAESAWVRDEAATARDSGRLLPVTVDGSQAPLGFRQFQTLDLKRWKGGKKDPRTEVLLNAVERRLKTGTAVPRATNREHDPTATDRFKALPRRAAAGAAVALLLISAALVFFLRAERAQTSLAVAVLPFSDLSPTHDKAYLAEGIGEQILSSLGTVPKLRVIGRTSAMAIGPDPDPHKLRSTLGITHLVEGSARTLANEIRVDVRLIRTSDGSEVWTHEYRGSLNDIFRIQDDVAKSVTDQLNLALAPQTAAAPKAPVDAYEMYLAARALQHTRTLANLERASAIARQLVTKAPTYAPGHALLSELNYMLSDTEDAFGSVPISKARTIAIAEAQRAIRLAPNAPEGYAALGLATIDIPGPQTIAALRKAIQLDPSRGELRIWLGLAFTSLKRNDEAAEQYRAASEMEPLWFPPVLNLANVLQASNRFPDALRAIEEFRARGGSRAMAFVMEADAKAAASDFSGAVAAYRQALMADPEARDAGEFMADTLWFVGLHPTAANLGRMSDFMRDLLSGDEEALERRVASDPRAVWGNSDQTIIVRTLAKRRDWQDILAVYDARPGQQNICASPPYFAPSVILALRQVGRAEEASRNLSCFQQSISSQLQMTYRSADDFAGELEEMQAAALALRGDGRAIDWLNRAVDRGWVGFFFSPNLHDWREFDALWADPRMNAVQQRINGIIARERAETIKELRQEPR